MAHKKIRVTIHVSDALAEGEHPDVIPNCLSSEGCAGSGSSIGSKSGGSRFTVFEGHDDLPDIEVQVFSPLTESDASGTGGP